MTVLCRAVSMSNNDNGPTGSFGLALRCIIDGRQVRASWRPDILQQQQRMRFAGRRVYSLYAEARENDGNVKIPPLRINVGRGPSIQWPFRSCRHCDRIDFPTMSELRAHTYFVPLRRCAFVVSPETPVCADQCRPAGEAPLRRKYPPRAKSRISRANTFPLVCISLFSPFP